MDMALLYQSHDAAKKLQKIEDREIALVNIRLEIAKIAHKDPLGMVSFESRFDRIQKKVFQPIQSDSHTVAGDGVEAAKQLLQAAETIQAGDVVRLKSGGPEMVVANVSEFDVATLEHFESGEIKEAKAMLTSLEKVTAKKHATYRERLNNFSSAWIRASKFMRESQPIGFGPACFDCVDAFAHGFAAIALAEMERQKPVMIYIDGPNGLKLAGYMRKRTATLERG